MRQTVPLRHRQGGAIAILFGLMLLGIMGMIGMALDLALVYNRKAELQMLADATALAAASQLNGKDTGVSNALVKAAETAAALRYQYNQLPIDWSGDALRFSSASDAPDGGWVHAGAAQAAAADMLFAKVDTGKLDQNGSGISRVNTFFIRVLSSALASTTMTAQAIAGRASTNVLPLAICAQSNAAAAPRANGTDSELVEYGFRRGVGYNLMQLNPHGATAENFLIDPMAPPGVNGEAANLATDVVGPFVCSGSMPMSSVLGGAITVKRGFPIDTLYRQLNSRLDNYTGNVCNAEVAPPDTNVRPYPFAAAGWISSERKMQTAAAYTSAAPQKWTVADPLPGLASAEKDYGVLWSAARAVKYAAAEPAAGYEPYAATDWSRLYTPFPPSQSGYPTQTDKTPYKANSGSNFLAPAAARRPGVAGRRMLNVALLACPVPAGGTVKANVVAIGKFFMTVEADDGSISAEFAGLASPASLIGAVELKR